MLPHLGAGAGQGLEDAYVLSHLLCHPDATVNNLEVRAESQQADHFAHDRHRRYLARIPPFANHEHRWSGRPAAMQAGRMTSKAHMDPLQKVYAKTCVTCTTAYGITT